MPNQQWDIFCKVIDNYGDLGVCWRLSAQLAARGHRVRLWVDDSAAQQSEGRLALEWMAPGGCSGVQVRDWPALPLASASADAPGDVVVEAFGCDPPEWFVSHMAQRREHSGLVPVWINLEYLSAEGFTERAHGLTSPVMAGAAKGLSKVFFYPGFTPQTGGLLREPDLLERQAAFDAQTWAHSRGIAPTSGPRISLFCYEPAALSELVSQLRGGAQETQLLATAGRASAALRTVLTEQSAQLGCADAQPNRLKVTELPRLSQNDYDHLLWASDLNFVRGEDSLVRAIWAGKPFVWQIYPQDDGAHAAKLEAFLQWFDPAPSLAQFHLVWNGLVQGALPKLNLEDWRAASLAARTRLLQQDDLVTGLERCLAATRASN